MRSEPHGPQNKGCIDPPHSSPEEIFMLQVKHFDRDEDYHVYPTNVYLPVPCFIPASQQCPVLRFQANGSPSNIVLVMSFSHFALDGTGAGTVLEALAQCCRAIYDGSDMAIVTRVAKTKANLRNDVSSWPSRCKSRLNHSLELGSPVFDSSIKSEQWAVMETAIPSVVRTRRFTF